MPEWACLCLRPLRVSPIIFVLHAPAAKTGRFVIFSLLLFSPRPALDPLSAICPCYSCRLVLNVRTVANDVVCLAVVTPFAQAVCDMSDRERVVGLHFLGPNAGEVRRYYRVVALLILLRETCTGRSDSTVRVSRSNYSMDNAMVLFAVSSTHRNDSSPSWPALVGCRCTTVCGV